MNILIILISLFVLNVSNLQDVKYGANPSITIEELGLNLVSQSYEGDIDRNNGKKQYVRPPYIAPGQSAYVCFCYSGFILDRCGPCGKIGEFPDDILEML